MNALSYPSLILQIYQSFWPVSIDYINSIEIEEIEQVKSLGKSKLLIEAIVIVDAEYEYFVDKMETLWDETLLNSQALVSGPAVFAGILMIVQHAKMKTLYKGSLPFELQLKNSQDDLRIRFGKTLDNDDEFLWDQWLIDNLNLTVTYSKDLKSLNRVSVQLPEEE